MCVFVSVCVCVRERDCVCILTYHRYIQQKLRTFISPDFIIFASRGLLTVAWLNCPEPLSDYSHTGDHLQVLEAAEQHLHYTAHFLWLTECVTFISQGERKISGSLTISMTQSSKHSTSVSSGVLELTLKQVASFLSGVKLLSSFCCALRWSCSQLQCNMWCNPGTHS